MEKCDRKTAEKNTKKLLEILHNYLVHSAQNHQKKKKVRDKFRGGIFARKCCVKRATFFGGLKGDSRISSVVTSQKIQPLTQSEPNRGGHSPHLGIGTNRFQLIKRNKAIANLAQSNTW